MAAEADLRGQDQSVPLDWAAIGTYLARHGMRLDDDPAPRQFAGGLANLNYLIHLDGKPAVLRRPPMGDLPAGAYDMAREFRILSRLPDALPFIARGLHLCDDPAIIGQRFQIIEYRPGLVIREHMPPDLAHRWWTLIPLTVLGVALYLTWRNMKRRHYTEHPLSLGADDPGKAGR